MTLVPLSQLFTGARAANTPVAIVEGREVDFAIFAAHVAWNARALRAIGCRRGLLVAKDGYWGAVGLLALHHAGATAILPQTLQPQGLEALEADCIVTDAVASSTVAPSRKSHTLEAREAPAAELGALNPALAKIELYTAGSTGAAKCVAKVLADMEAETTEIHAALGANLRTAAVFATVPYHHLYGLTFRLVWPLSAGWRLLGQTHQYWEALAQEMTPDAILVTSPAHLTRLPDLAFPVERRPQCVLSAGAALSDQAAHATASQLGVPVTDIFGSTETGVIAYRKRTGDAVPWRPFPGVAVRTGEDNRLAVQARHIGHGTQAGWFETADVGEVGPDGTFVLRGRVDQILKVEGNRVSLPALENLLNASPLVEAAAVVLLEGDSATLGAAVVLTAEGQRALREIGAFRLGRQLRQTLAQRHAPTGLPKRWRFVERLPEAVLGKRRRHEILALFAEDNAPTEPEVRALRPVEDGVEIDLFLAETLLPLRGHFPDFPVVPGVALIDWVVRFAREHLGAPRDAGRAFQIKFRRVITAPSLITLNLTRQAERIQFEYRQGEIVLSAGILKLRASL